MPRRPRFAPPGLALHVTQRGNFGQPTFFTDADRLFYLKLLERHSEEHRVRVIAWCMMSNHSHLIVIPDEEEALSNMMERLAGDYAKFLNCRLRRSGHLWKDRYFACVLDEKHFACALRYVELNPVRARMTSRAEEYRWSTAAVHLGFKKAPPWLDTQTFESRFDLDYWRLALGAKQPRRELSPRACVDPQGHAPRHPARLRALRCGVGGAFRRRVSEAEIRASKSGPKPRGVPFRKSFFHSLSCCSENR
jgi:putative transposase